MLTFAYIFPQQNTLCEAFPNELTKFNLVNFLELTVYKSRIKNEKGRIYKSGYMKKSASRSLTKENLKESALKIFYKIFLTKSIILRSLLKSKYVHSMSNIFIAACSLSRSKYCFLFLLKCFTLLRKEGFHPEF